MLIACISKSQDPNNCPDSFFNHIADPCLWATGTFLQRMRTSYGGPFYLSILGGGVQRAVLQSKWCRSQGLYWLWEVDNPLDSLSPLWNLPNWDLKPWSMVQICNAASFIMFMLRTLHMAPLQQLHTSTLEWSQRELMMLSFSGFYFFSTPSFKHTDCASWV